MLPVFWRASARNDLAKIIRFCRQRKPDCGASLRTIIEASVLPATEHPYLYRTGVVPGTREIVAHPNYIVVYRVRAERIEVVNVVHARQEYP